MIEKELIENKQIIYLQYLLKKFVNIAKTIENVDASKYRSTKLKQRLQKKFPALVFCTPKVRSVSEIVFCFENLTCMELLEDQIKVAKGSEGEEHENEEEIDFGDRGRTDFETDDLKTIHCIMLQ